jgi:hypothetical protein
MNFSTSVSTIFFGLCVFGAVTSSLAFSSATISNSITASSARLSNNNKGTTTQLNYMRVVEMHGVSSFVLDSSSLSKTNKIEDCLSSLDEDEDEDDDDFVDPMEEAFDNMQHPMELMLLSRACIPYVAM